VTLLRDCTWGYLGARSPDAPFLSLSLELLLLPPTVCPVVLSDKDPTMDGWWRFWGFFRPGEDLRRAAGGGGSWGIAQVRGTHVTPHACHQAGCWRRRQYDAVRWKKGRGGACCHVVGYWCRHSLSSGLSSPLMYPGTRIVGHVSLCALFHGLKAICFGVHKSKGVFANASMSAQLSP